jgi:transposase-like protein
VFPETRIQTCIVHLLRDSMDCAGWKDRKPIATAPKTMYRAVDAEAAALALSEFEEGPWGRQYPDICAAWRRHWAEVIPFFADPAEVCRMVYTTNASEYLNSTIRRSVRARGHFPSDEGAVRVQVRVRPIPHPGSDRTAARSRPPLRSHPHLIADTAASRRGSYCATMPVAATRLRR